MGTRPVPVRESVGRALTFYLHLYGVLVFLPNKLYSHSYHSLYLARKPFFLSYTIFPTTWVPCLSLLFLSMYLLRHLWKNPTVFLMLFLGYAWERELKQRGSGGTRTLKRMCPNTCAGSRLCRVRCGRLVKLKVLLAMSPELMVSSANILQDLQACFHHFASRRNLAPLGTWRIPLHSEVECFTPRPCLLVWASGGRLLALCILVAEDSSLLKCALFRNSLLHFY